MRWPWIGREHHEEVIAAKDAQLRWQQETISALEARIAAPVEVTVKLPDDFAVVQPAILRTRKPLDPNKPAKAVSEEPDWVNLDENDPAALAKAAAYELGGPTNPYVLAQTIKQIKANIVRAKTDRNRRTLESSSVGTIPSTEPGISPTQPDYIPESVQKRIQAAAEGRVV